MNQMCIYIYTCGEANRIKERRPVSLKSCGHFEKTGEKSIRSDSRDRISFFENIYPTDWHGSERRFSNALSLYSLFLFFSFFFFGFLYLCKDGKIFVD